MPREAMTVEPTGRPASNVIAAVMAEPWAILPAHLQTILSVAERTNLSVEQLEAERGEELKNTRNVTVRDGVATIPVRGPTFRYANLFTRISGATSYAELATDFTAAMKNPDIGAIILAIDSPGGQVNGNAETAAMVAAARGIKPVVAYISGTGASAAYFIASAAARIVVDPTALVGSIGTVATAQVNEDDDTIQIVSTQSPKKRLNPATPEGRASMQSTVDAIAQVFVERVAEYRGVAVDRVLSDFGQGDLLVGQAAVDAGMADEVGNYESVLTGLRTSAMPGVSPVRRLVIPGVRATTNEESLMENGNPAAAGAATPQPPATGAPAAGAPAPAAAPAPSSSTVVDLAQVRREAAEQERARITAISALKKPGNEKMIQACLDDASCSIEMAKARLYDHERATGADRLNGIKGDEANTPAPTATPTGAGPEEKDPRAAARAAVQLHRTLNTARGR